MTITGNIAAFRADWDGRTTLLGLDLGERTIGLAGSDASNRLATPLTTLKRTRFHRDAPSIERLVTLRDAGGLVLGWPIQMDDVEGPRCRATRAYARNLEERTGLPILLMDERLSTFAAGELYEETHGRRPPRGERIDHYAAAVILQEALDGLRR